MADFRDKKRPTIGFLTANIHIGASRVLWPGILDGALSENVNLICFPGGRLNAAEDAESMRNVIYQQVDTNHLDGLVIWTSAIAGSTTPQKMIRLNKHFKDLPLVNLADYFGNGPRVVINDVQGMRALLMHLIEEHGYERIALIRGPENHHYASERYRAYLELLNEQGLIPDESLTSPPVGWNDGANAMSVLLDERGLLPGRDFQAVVAASDLLAIGAIQLLAERGYHIPTDVAVAGFNDIEEGRLIRPPLTSVSLPFYQQGRYSLETLCAVLDGKEVSDRAVLDSRLLVRQSCGCHSWSEALATAVITTGTQSNKGNSSETQKRLAAQIFRVISNRGVAATWAKQLVDAFRSEMDGSGHGRFRTTLDGMLQQGVLGGDETSAWQNTISIIRSDFLPTLNESQYHKAEALFGQARVVIGDAVQRAHIARHVQAERQGSVLGDIGQALITTFDMDRLTDVLADRLPELGIRSAYLALFEDKNELAPTSRLIMAFSNDGRIPLEPNGRVFPTSQLIPPHVLPERRHSLLVEPLFFQQEQLGIIVFEIGPRDGNLYEALRGHISSALKGALLFQEAYEARLAAEQADKIKTRLLANVSHELRTPLNIIIGHAQRLLPIAPSELDQDLTQIEHSAEHQLRVINDLLDLSRAEINALDLYPMMLDPHTLISEAFSSMSRDALEGVLWQLEIPTKLPVIEADPVRLRQILLNLLSNAAHFTYTGQITLGAETTDSQLHIWVADTGVGIPKDLIDRIYEPFVTNEMGNQLSSGIGLGLSITRHLVMLHGGLLNVESSPSAGSTFHVYLPRPTLDESFKPKLHSGSPIVWFISRSDTLPLEIIADYQERQFKLKLLHPQESWEDALQEDLPSATIWDTAGTESEDWLTMRRMHNHPRLHQVPFILHQQESAQEVPVGLTSMVVKAASPQDLWTVIRPTAPNKERGTVLIVDDDPQARQLTFEAVQKGLPGYKTLMAENGAQGLAMLGEKLSDLVILDLMMPEMDGFEMLEAMRLEPRTRKIPVVILSGRQLSLEDIKRLEQYTAVSMRSKEIYSQDEIASALHQSLFGTASLPDQTSALAKQAVAYLHQNYARSLSRFEIANELGMSEDYFSRAFNKELGISPWDYLNRYRIFQAKILLVETSDNVRAISYRVGFSDPAYFSRVFRKIVGQSPSAFRKKST